MSFFEHEAAYRSPAVMQRLQAARVTVCGAGAVGANLVEMLARMGFGQLCVIDRDRVDARNLSTQPWSRGDVGSAKATLLANALYRAVKTEVEAHVVELTERNAEKLLRGAAVVVDAFDNSVARRTVKETCTRLDIPCLHIGLARDYAEAVWNDRYVVPSDANDDVCDYPLTRTLVMLAVASGAELLVRMLVQGTCESVSVTLGDFAIQPMA